MNCATAQKNIAKLVDGVLSEQERSEIDRHIAVCEACEESMTDALVFRQLATTWASALANAADPGEQMNVRVLSAIAGRSPGKEIQTQRRKLLNALFIMFTIVATIGLGYFVKLPAVPSYNMAPLFGSFFQLLNDNRFLPNSQIPVAYCYVIVAGLLLTNFILYTKPVRRLLRAI
jgi:anti-sigma factor RsiW